MPIDLEMLLSTSNPLFAYSPFSDDRFPVNSYNDNDYSRNLSLQRNPYHLRPHAKQLGFLQRKPVFNSCTEDLHLKSKHKATSNSDLSECSRKKKVSFADDRGLNLVEIREIPGAPKWADDVLTLLIGGAKRSVVREKKWKVAFEHPPWEDDKLVEYIEKNMVALESVNVKECMDDTLYGTIKVKNLAYKKNIFIRVTFDRWVSYTDVPAVYVQPKEADSTKSNLYDTFSFQIKISPAASRYDVIEFCICFKCKGQKYWDNNGGINYRLLAESSRCNSAASDNSCNNVESTHDKVTLSLTADIENLSEINAWNSFMCCQPYW